MRKRLAAICLILVLVLCVASVSASAANEQQKLTASDAARGDRFGKSVFVSGNTAIIGAPHDAGSAYVFRYDGSDWVEVQKLTASDNATEAYFGNPICIVGDTALIGAMHDESGRGSVYVFRYDGSNWTEEQKLTASDGAAGDYFGHSVSISGTTALIGASRDEGYAGSAYVFRYDGSNWTEEQKLTAGDPATWDTFGASVAINGSAALIGAVGDQSYAGAVYVFKHDGSNWTEVQKLTASDGTANDCFGDSLCVSNNTALIGAIGDVSGAGSAYVFRYDGSNWTEVQKLTASGGDSGDAFGDAVAISGSCSTAIIGALGDEDTGSAYVFRYDGSNWVEEQKLTASDGGAWDGFGHSVSISGSTALIGAPWDEIDVGSAYIFSLYTTIPVTIDIMRGGPSNRINMKSRGVVPVAILGSETFDVGDIDATTIAFGPSNASPVHNLADPIVYAGHLQDINEDGYVDLVVHFKVQEIGLKNTDTAAELRAAIDSVTGIVGSDCVEVKNG